MRYIAIVPAAGSGSRMGGDRPKQYWPLHGRPLLWYAVETLVSVPRIDAVCVVLSPEDTEWDQYDWSPLGSKLRTLRVGGATRAQSVANALSQLSGDMSAHAKMMSTRGSLATFEMSNSLAVVCFQVGLL